MPVGRQWDCIQRTASWDVVHAFGTSLEGWTVLVVRRHISSPPELSIDEAAELGALIQSVSRAIETVTGCEKTYVVQFAEHPDHPHVHVHLIPRQADLAADLRGPGVSRLQGVDDETRVTDRRMNEISEQIAEQLSR